MLTKEENVDDDVYDLNDVEGSISARSFSDKNE
jgi:hypothetical protein